jgi:hypothetical protein
VEKEYEIMKIKRKTSIHFRVTEPEKAALEKIAISEWRTPSEVLRELLRREFKTRGVNLDNTHDERQN